MSQLNIQINDCETKLKSMSDRQSEVFHALIDGKSRKQVAKKFGISYHTVNAHIREILRRTKSGSLAELSKNITAYHLLLTGNYTKNGI